MNALLCLATIPMRPVSTVLIALSANVLNFTPDDYAKMVITLINLRNSRLMSLNRYVINIIDSYVQTNTS